jgi:tetratricopeptide (TPR) repeat protein
MQARVISITTGLWLLAPWFAVAQPAHQPPVPASQEKLQKQVRQLGSELEQLHKVQKEQAQVEQDRATLALLEEVREAVAKDQKAAELRMNEDIEVMRRILDASLRRVWQSSPSSWRSGSSGKLGAGAVWALDTSGQPGPVNRGGQDSTSNTVYVLTEGTRLEAARAVDPHVGLHDWSILECIEGTYLKGYGVVFSASLPVRFEEAVTQVAKPARKPLSDWERVRKELRGEKVQPEDKQAQEPKSASLADTVLKVLADNGHHFTQLAENEQITVAVTLRQQWRHSDQACLQCHQAIGAMSAFNYYGISPYVNLSKPDGGGTTPAGATGSGAGNRVGPSPRGGTTPPGPGSGIGTGGPVGGSSGAAGPVDGHQETVKKALDFIRRATEQPETEAQNEALLGDLHLKQGRYKEAVAAYQKAVESHRKALENRRRAEPDLQGMTSVDVKGNLKAVELHTKLAQALLAADELEQALKTFQQITHASEALVKAYQSDVARQQTQRPPLSKPGEADPAIPLPLKLIISAPQKLLDQVGAGKISFEDFKKAVTVQYVGFPSSKEASTKPGG